jgi:hypothetical protein
VLVQGLDLPPIRLHDLRHGAATIALASRTDLKVIQQMLGHSSIVTTADTYTSVLPEAAHRAAQATADMIIEAARSVHGARPGGVPVTHIPAGVTASGYCQMWVHAAQSPVMQGIWVPRAGVPQLPARPRVTQECPIHAPQ